MKKVFLKIIILFSIILLSIILINITYATDATESISKEDLTSYLNSVDTGSVNASDIVDMYDELAEQYSNKEIAEIIEENKENIMEEAGIDEETLSTGTDLLRTLDTEETKKILKEDLNIDEIQEKLDNGYTINEVVKDLQEQMSSSQKISIALKLLLASYIVKIALVLLTILIAYKILIRWIIFKKANKHGWATLIPIYNEVVYLKVCDISPWWMLMLLIPIIGWLIYLALKISARFSLAESFGKGVLFGFGLLLFGIIFESILAFNKNIEYVEYEE